MTSSPPAVARRRPGSPRRWTAADKTRHRAAFAARGLTIAAYCAAAGVPTATFTLWQREQRRGRRSRFAQVEVVAPARAEPRTLRVRSPAVEAEIAGLDVAALVAVLGTVFRAR